MTRAPAVPRLRFGDLEDALVQSFGYAAHFTHHAAFGLVGYAWRRLRSQAAALVLGAMFIGEAVLLSLAGSRPPTVTALESAGVLLTAMLLVAARWSARQTTQRR